MKFSDLFNLCEGKTRFILIRHGQSLGNEKNLYLGHTDLDLSSIGYKQADICAKFFEKFPIDLIYSSDLLRAHNTAAAHAALHNLAVNDSSELREIFLGEWESKNVEELKLNDYFINCWCEEFGTCEVPGGERVVDCAMRIYNELYRIAKENLGKTILVGLHGAAIRSFYARIMGILPQNVGKELPFPTNASATLVSFENGAFTPQFYSFDEYLGNSNSHFSPYL